MGFSPWYLGDRLPIWTFELVPDTGTLDITGLSTSNFSLVFINTFNMKTRSGTGVFSNLVAGPPVTILYTVGANDVATAGIYEVRTLINAGTSSQRTFSMGTWQCAG